MGETVIDLVLKPDRDRSLRRRHPWVWSGSVARVDGTPEPGAWVRVRSSEGEPLGFGHFAPASNLPVRMLAFGKEPPGPDWLETRVGAALARRTADPLLGDTDALRLVNAEGDGLPGLTVDLFADLAVVKLTAIGMATRREEIGAVLREATGAGVGFERADAVAARREGFDALQGPLWGAPPADPVTIRERERRYAVDVVHGQKTGFYLDQRESRDLVARLAPGRRVLDLFAYTGGFAVAAARAGAAHVTLVESSEPALSLADANLTDNAPGCPVALERADAFRYLRGAGQSFDLCVVDPPPLARARRDVARASRAYKDLLLFTLRRTAPGGHVLAFACSHHVGPDLFRKIAFAAALDAGREVQVLRTLGPPSDHPVSIHHPEGSYLTGLLLRT
jgi:23S rRNA (cytosine1962-C5)-methyltransferase